MDLCTRCLPRAGALARCLLTLALVGLGCRGFQAQPSHDAGLHDAEDRGLTFNDLAPLRPDQAYPDRSCSSSLASDPHNCGACGRDCQGGACQEGVCQPLILAETRPAPQDIAVGGGFAYWVEQGTFANAAHDGAVLRIPAGGCPPQTPDCPTKLAENQYSPGGIALDSSNLYWLELGDGTSMVGTGRVWKLALGTSQLSLFASSQDRPRKVALDTTRLFWITATEVRSAFLDGGTVNGVVLASNQASPVDLTVKGSSLYWTNYGDDDYNGSIMASDLDGSNLRSVAKNQQIPRGVAVGPTYLYWTNVGNGTIMRIPTSQGPTPEPLVSSASTPNDVTLDHDWLYWVEGGTAPYYLDGRVMAMKLDSSAKRTLASGQVFPRAIAVDDTCVYWVNRGTPDTDKFDGAVAKVAKPQ